MPLITIGMNHTTGPVEIRERIVIDESVMQHALSSLIVVPAIHEATIVSTCNRTELYCETSDPKTGQSNALQWLIDYRQLAPDSTKPYFYQYHNRDAIRHLFRVACGLDSMVLGEPQILGQLKSAYHTADIAGTLGRNLNPLFQQAFGVAKKVRTHTSIGVNPVSVASTAVALAKRIFGSLANEKALFIGAGETIRLAITHMRNAGLQQLYVANRSIERAHQLASEHHGHGIGLSSISEVLEQCDIVITATASPLPILGKGLLERCVKKRKHKPIFIVDLAVPRDVEPEAGDLPDIYLYSVDDLQAVIEENMASRQEAASTASQIIDAEVEKYWLRLRELSAVDLIRAYRSQAEQHKDELLMKTNRMLEQGKPVDEALHFLANGLVNKLLHNPTEALKSAGQADERNLLTAVKALLGIHSPTDDQE